MTRTRKSPVAAKTESRELAIIAAPAATEVAIVDRLVTYADQAAGAFADNTVRAIKSDTDLFRAWCADRGLASLPALASTVRTYVDASAELHSVATIRRRMASIAHMHRAAGIPDPTKESEVRLAVKRMARTKGTRQRQAKAITETEVAQILAAVGAKSRARDLRDVAMLLAGRDLLGRRSEVVGLNREDIERHEDGSGIALLGRSKTDQEGQGAVVYLSARTMTWLGRWLAVVDAAEPTAHASNEPRPLFRSITKVGKVGPRLSDEDVRRAYRRLVELAGLDPEGYSGHSCRVGMSQDLTAAGMDLASIMQAGRWKSPTMPARYAAKLLAGRGAVAQFYERRMPR